MAFLGYVWYHGLFVSCLEWSRCWTFFFEIRFCTELLCFGRGIEITYSLNNCFLEYLGGPEKGLAGQKPAMTGWLLRRLLLLRRCCSGDSEESWLLLLLLRLLNDLCRCQIW